MKYPFTIDECLVKPLPPKDIEQHPAPALEEDTPPPTEAGAAQSPKLSQEDEDRIMRFIDKHKKLLEKLA